MYPTTEKYTGLSLSFCVKEIIKGILPESSVIEIVCGFDYDGTIPEKYFDIHWSNFDRAEVEALISRLKIRGNKGGHNIAKGNWMVGEATQDRLHDHEDRFSFWEND